MTPPTRPMTPPTQIWLSAALLGSLWAAIEIILGSFLHNLGLPFTGTILSAFGVALMAAGTQVWPEKGILWRAGILCALMKSVSPSAVILGPMVGIALEALIMEWTTRLLGRNIAGLLLGGALAATLPIFQRIAGLLFTYGLDIARLYMALYETAAGALHISTFGAIDLVVAWLAMNLLLGAGAALIGMRAGIRARILPDPPPVPLTEGSVYSLGAPDPGQAFSRRLLLAHIIVLPTGFLAIRDWPILYSAPAIVVYVVLTFLLYPRIRRRFRRIRPWVEFLAVSTLAGFVLGGIGAPSDDWPGSGLALGVQMALRAILVIIAFSAISIELRNPLIVQWFFRRGLSPLSSALDVAFQALPAMIQAIGEERSFLRHPRASVARVIAVARGWLRRFEQEGPARIAVLTGEQGRGKTLFAERLASILKERGLRVAGIIAPVVYEGGERSAYLVRNLLTGGETELCRKVRNNAVPDVGPFQFHDDGIEFGEEALRAGDGETPDVVILDEVGPLECAGKGWADALTRLRRAPFQTLILVVRPSLLEEVRMRWNFTPQAVWEVGTTTHAEAVDWVVKISSPKNP